MQVYSRKPIRGRQLAVAPDVNVKLYRFTCVRKFIYNDVCMCVREILHSFLLNLQPAHPLSCSSHLWLNLSWWAVTVMWIECDWRHKGGCLRLLPIANRCESSISAAVLASFPLNPFFVQLSRKTTTLSVSKQPVATVAIHPVAGAMAKVSFQNKVFWENAQVFFFSFVFNLLSLNTV